MTWRKLSSKSDPFGVVTRPLGQLLDGIEFMTNESLIASATESRRPAAKPAKSKTKSSLHLFVSYATEDEEFAHQLCDDLRAVGYEMWIDDLGLRTGDDWPEKVADAIEQARAILLVASPDAFESKWVRRELAFADEGEKRILPIVHRPTTFPKGFTFRFGTIQRADFTRGNYEKNLARLTQAIAETCGDQIVSSVLRKGGIGSALP